MDQPLMVEIIAYAPTAFYHCMHCEVVWHEMGTSQKVHQEQLDASLPGDLAQEYQAISDWVAQVFDRHGDQVVIKVVDAASLEGFAKSLRYSVHGYPTVIVDHKKCFTGGDLKRAGDEIDRALSEARVSSP
jgi:hypothetical protein